MSGMQITDRKIVAVLLASTLLPLVSLDAFAQHGHEPPPATIGDRKLTVSLNLDAIAGDRNEYLCSLKLVDIGTNKTVPHVTFFVTLKKEGMVLFKEWFHDHEGDLPLKIRPKDTGKVTVYGVKEPTLNGYMKSGENPVVIEGPVLIANGVYDFTVEIFSIDNDKTLLNEPLKYEISVPVGETEESSKPPTQQHDHQTDISVAMKLAKKTTLLAIKNTGDMEVHSVKIKANDGTIRFVKAKGWDREKVDSNTVIIKTVDKPISSGKNLLVMLIIDNNASGIEWTAFDANATTLSSGALIPEL